MSKPVPKPHRLKVYAIGDVGPKGETLMWLTLERLCASKGEAERAKRSCRQYLGRTYSSATIEPEPQS